MGRYITLTIYICILSNLSYANECIPTPHRTTGTHYEPVTVQKINVGEGVKVYGQVLAAPDCIPIEKAKVAHWQAGENGRYSDSLRAYLFTDERGRFQFETEWPNLKPPHIHFIVSADGYEILETQWIGEHRTRDIKFNIVVEAR